MKNETTFWTEFELFISKSPDTSSSTVIMQFQPVPLLRRLVGTLSQQDSSISRQSRRDKVTFGEVFCMCTFRLPLPGTFPPMPILIYH